MEIEQVERKLENMHFDSIVKSYCNKVNDIKRLKAENKELNEQLRLHSVNNSVAFGDWIGNKLSMDSWFRYEHRTRRWYLYLHGHLTTEQLYEIYLKEATDC